MAEQVADDGLQHLIARSMSKGVVDRLQAINIEHDQRATGLIALDVGNRAVEFALEAAPVGDFQQEIGFGGGLQFVDLRLCLRQLGPQPANGRFGVVGRNLLGRPPRMQPCSGWRAGMRPC